MSICFFMCVQCTHSSQSSIDKRAFTFRGQSITKPNCNKGRPKSNRNRYLSAYKTGFIATLFDMLISKKKNSDAILYTAFDGWMIDLPSFACLTVERCHSEQFRACSLYWCGCMFSFCLHKRRISFSFLLYLYLSLVLVSM